jgi:hypothetical protein
MENGTLYDQIVALWPALGGVPGWVVFAAIVLLMANIGLGRVLLFLHLRRRDPYAEYKKEKNSNAPETRTYRKHPSGTDTGWSDTGAAEFKGIQKKLRAVFDIFKRGSREARQKDDWRQIEIFPPTLPPHDKNIKAARDLKVVESSDGSYWVGDRRFFKRPDAQEYLDLVRRSAKYN